MYPHLRSLVARLKDKPFVLLGVNSDGLELARRVQEEEGITWRSFWAGPLGTKGPIPTQWCIRGWPTSFLIDHTGVIRYRDIGGSQLDQALDELIDLAEADTR